MSSHRRPAVKRSVLEEERREEGLANKIDESNVGFRLLEKMGYKKGEGIGKSQAATASTDPLAFDIKNDKMGLGIREGKKRKMEKEMKKQKETSEALLSNFQSHQRQRYNDKKHRFQLSKALKLMQTLDEQNDVREGENKLAVLLKASNTEDDDESDEEEEDSEAAELKKLPIDEQLMKVLHYLREKHLYCMFCSSNFSDAEDMKANCPGLLEEDHD